MGRVDLQHLVAAAPLTALDEAAFRQVKYEDFRRPTTVIGFAGVVLVFSLWIWDWAIDARHAPETFWLRILLSVSILTYPLALMAGVRRWLPLVFYAMLVWLEAVFLLILRRLDGGSVYGMAGFMFWFIVPPLMSFILPLRANILGNLAVLAGSSLLAGPAGLLPEMDLLRLNAILVPACGITVAGHVMIDRLLRRIYEYRWQVEWRSVAIDALAEGVTIIQNGAIRYANQAAAALVGRRPDQLVGAQLADFARLDEQTDLSQPLRIETGEKETWVRIGRSAILWQGRPATLVSVSDITNQMRADAALRSSEQRYREVVDNVSEGIIVVQDEAFVFTNPAAASLTGYEPEEMRGRPFADFVHAEDLAMVAERYRRRLAGEPLDPRYEFRILKKGGAAIWAQLSGVVIQWNGRPASLYFISDVDERKQAEAALRHSEERYRLLVDNASEGILISQQGILRFINPRIAELAGREASELAGQPLLRFVHPDDHPTLFERYRRRQRGEAVPQHEVFRLLRPDGETVWIEYSGVDVVWEGRPAVLSFLIDITERKRAEDDLRRSEENYRHVIENSPVGITIIRGNGMVLANRALCRMLEETESDLLDRSSFLSLVHEDDRPMMQDHAEHIAREPEGGKAVVNFRVLTPGGRVVWVEGNTVQVEWEGKPVTLSFIHDVTERRRLEEDLRQTLAERETILQSALVGIIHSKDRCHQWVNRAFAEMVGYRQEEIIGQPSRLHFPDEASWRRFGEEAYAVLATGEAFSSEWEMVRRDGTRFWTHIFGQSVIPRDPAQGSIWTLVDITSRKQAEAEIRAALERQKELSELKTRFVSMTSHEFRTPLAAILSSAELLQHYGERLPAEEKLELAGSIGQAVRRMTHMLDDILVIGRAEADRLGFAPAPLDQRGICAKVGDEAALDAQVDGMRGERIVLRMADGEIEALLDEKLMRHILGNLLSNALKYSPDDRPVVLAVEADAASLRFTVSDEGIGIPPQDLPRLFETFHRARNVGNVSGTGLGLAIVKKAVELHGGRVEVQSALGAGSRFIVTLERKS